MPRIFPVIVKRVTQIIGGAANYLARVTAVTRISWVGTLVERVRPATRQTLAPARLTVPQRPATTVSTFSVAALVKPLVAAGSRVTAIFGGTVKLLQRPAASMSFGAPLTLKTVERSAGRIVQVTFDLTHTSHVVTAAQDAGGTGTWSNPTRIQGAPQGTQAGSATFAGGLVLGTGKLRGTAMVAQLNRPTSLAILEVWLQWHYQTTGLPVVSDLISQLALGYRINLSPLPGVDKDEVTVTSNDDFLVAGREIRINRSGVDVGKFTDGAAAATSTDVTWANVALIQPFFNATTIANGLMSYFADAVRLRVVAREVQAT